MTDIVERLIALATSPVNASFIGEAADEIVTLRQRVKMLEFERDDAEEIVRKFERQMLALKAGQGEPAAYIFGHADCEQDALLPHEVEPDTFNEHPEFYTALYTSAPSIPAGYVLVPVEPSDEWCYRFEENTFKKWPLDSLRRELRNVIAAAPKHTPTTTTKEEN